MRLSITPRERITLDEIMDFIHPDGSWTVPTAIIARRLEAAAKAAVRRSISKRMNEWWEPSSMYAVCNHRRQA
ncbi:MAG: hypothetical protein ACLUHA_06830 [Bacteroides stercoris]